MKELILDREFDSFVKNVEEKYSKKVKLSVDLYNINWVTWIKLCGIVIKPKHRGEGLGSLVMKDLIKYADEKGYKMMLEASDIFGSDPYRLIDYYSRFGFVHIGNFEMIR